jgi:DNA-binding NarL/FixJ family response regulator
VRAAVKTVLEYTPWLKVIAEVSHANELLNDYLLSHANVVVVDLALAGGSGANVVREVKRRQPKVRVVVHTAYPAEQFARRATRYGASGYVSKSGAADNLLEVISGMFDSHMTSQRNLAGTELHHRLSAPELESLLRWCQIENTSQIAESMGVSAAQLDGWLKRGLAQLRRESRAQVIDYFRSHRVID